MSNLSTEAMLDFNEFMDNFVPLYKEGDELVHTDGYDINNIAGYFEGDDFKLIFDKYVFTMKPGYVPGYSIVNKHCVGIKLKGLMRRHHDKSFYTERFKAI